MDCKKNVQGCIRPEGLICFMFWYLVGDQDVCFDFMGTFVDFLEKKIACLGFQKTGVSVSGRSLQG